MKRESPRTKGALTKKFDQDQFSSGWVGQTSAQAGWSQ